MNLVNSQVLSIQQSSMRLIDMTVPNCSRLPGHLVDHPDNKRSICSGYTTLNNLTERSSYMPLDVARSILLIGHLFGQLLQL